MWLSRFLSRSDSDEEPEEPDWVVRTKQQIADAQPHDDEVSVLHGPVLSG
jgi:hypothetical protein